MFHEIVLLALVASTAVGLEQPHAATSFATFNDNHNTVHHIHSAPELVKSTPIQQHGAPAHGVPSYRAPSYAAPSYTASSYSAPQVSSLFHSSLTPAQHIEPHGYGAPTIQYPSHAPLILKKKHEEEYGEYSLHEADGTVRLVKYTVDKHTGFNAVGEKTGHPQEVLDKAAPQYHHI
ncbi:hypothetical protein JTB14_017132 [Gonioctena quinquepunctata]|nr:hypothetical protein JTB14_017132 [Gonioctena quinquepunctata]